MFEIHELQCNENQACRGRGCNRLIKFILTPMMRLQVLTSKANSCEKRPSFMFCQFFMHILVKLYDNLCCATEFKNDLGR